MKNTIKLKLITATLLTLFSSVSTASNQQFLAFVGHSGMNNNSDIDYEVVPDTSNPGGKCEGKQLTRSELEQKINNNEDVTKACTSNITDMSRLFVANNTFNQDISNWDVSNVKDMSYMFASSNYNKSLEKWNVSNVENMSYMFMFSKYNQPLKNWNVSSVKNMTNMFDSSLFNQDISNWNTKKVEMMGYMFHNSSVFNQDLSKWNVDSLVIRNQEDIDSYNSSFNTNGVMKQEYYPKFKINN